MAQFSCDVLIGNWQKESKEENYYFEILRR